MSNCQDTTFNIRGNGRTEVREKRNDTSVYLNLEQSSFRNRVKVRVLGVRNGNIANCTNRGDFFWVESGKKYFVYNLVNERNFSGAQLEFYDTGNQEIRGKWSPDSVPEGGCITLTAGEQEPKPAPPRQEVVVTMKGRDLSFLNRPKPAPPRQEVVAVKTKEVTLPKEPKPAPPRQEVVAETNLAGILFDIGVDLSDGDVEYHFSVKDLNHEIDLVKSRSKTGDQYPQGVDKVIRTMEYCRKNAKTLYMVARKTWPKWTWYVSVQK